MKLETYGKRNIITRLLSLKVRRGYVHIGAHPLRGQRELNTYGVV